MDGTDSQGKLGANAILAAVSMATAKAGALEVTCLLFQLSGRGG